MLTAFQDVEDNVSTLRILADEARQQDVAVQAAQRSLDLAMAQYRSGVTSYLDVITAQSTLLTNQRTALTILGERMTASVRLDQGAGRRLGSRDAAEVKIDAKSVVRNGARPLAENDEPRLHAESRSGCGGFERRVRELTQFGAGAGLGVFGRDARFRDSVPPCLT